mmetsp:Transcript_18688/g.44656  ORF Transcript_18688/g.44656 Transcript_18688/m.44656 type:complete len:338 (+) Transcript_18688:309-1322(+)
MDSIGWKPEFSASASGMSSSASANARIAYCSTPATWSAAFSTARLHEISAAPPPYTILLLRTRLRATHRASCTERFVSSTTILFPPRTKIVTALERGQSSITSMRSRVVPNPISRTFPARPSFSGESSLKRGTILPPVAIAMSSSSTPPTQRTAGRLWWRSRWLASSSKPHWQMARVAPLSLHCCTMSVKYFCSEARRLSNFSTESMSTLCLVLGLGGSKGHVRMAILASLISLGICGWLMSLSMTMPLTSLVSSRLPPTLPSTLIRSRLTSPRSRSATERTALTQISAISLLQRVTILEERVVMQVFTSGSMSSLLNSKVVEISSRRWLAILQAIS